MVRPTDQHEAVEWRRFDDAGAMALGVADDVQSIIRSAIELRGSALVALPGGETPVPIFAEIVGREIDWPRVTLLPTDERLVPTDSPLSNAGLIRSQFGRTGAKLFSLFSGRSSPDGAGDAADRDLKTLRWPLDLVWLGMGEDGHTASILPGPDFDAALNGPADRYACTVTPDPLPARAPVARVTLTRPALVATRALILTILGDRKRVVAEQATKDGIASNLAIGSVLASARVSARIYWCP